MTLEAGDPWEKRPHLGQRPRRGEGSGHIDTSVERRQKEFRSREGGEAVPQVGLGLDALVRLLPPALLGTVAGRAGWGKADWKTWA